MTKSYVYPQVTNQSPLPNCKKTSLYYAIANAHHWSIELCSRMATNKVETSSGLDFYTQTQAFYEAMYWSVSHSKLKNYRSWHCDASVCITTNNPSERSLFVKNASGFLLTSFEHNKKLEQGLRAKKKEVSWIKVASSESCVGEWYPKMYKTSPTKIIFVSSDTLVQSGRVK